jgi:hypothetical protein
MEMSFFGGNREISFLPYALEIKGIARSRKMG